MVEGRIMEEQVYEYFRRWILKILIDKGLKHTSTKLVK